MTTPMTSSRGGFKLFRRKKTTQAELKQSEEFFRAGMWQLVWWKFRRHTLANIGMVVLGIFYFFAAFAEFMAPHDPLTRYKTFNEMPPQTIHIFDSQGKLHPPFIYGFVRSRDAVTLRPKYQENYDEIYPLKLFVRGDQYKMWKLIQSDLHLIGTGQNDKAPFFLFGSDTLGRDVFSRIIYGARISLTIGLIGIGLAFILGLILGGVAGFFGGLVDEVIMRVIDVLNSLPSIPLWMALAAAIPQDIPQVRMYFYITVILSILGWTSLARTIRSKMLSIREEDYITAAKLDSETDWQIITRYMLPGYASYIIVSVTLAIPGMILGETSLSFLGIGLHPPTISWGVMLQDCQNLNTISQLPWLLWPVAFVVIAVLMFNFMGDGLRDAADPYVT